MSNLELLEDEQLEAVVGGVTVRRCAKGKKKHIVEEEDLTEITGNTMYRNLTAGMTEYAEE